MTSETGLDERREARRREARGRIERITRLEGELLQARAERRRLRRFFITPFEMARIAGLDRTITKLEGQIAEEEGGVSREELTRRAGLELPVQAAAPQGVPLGEGKERLAPGEEVAQLRARIREWLAGAVNSEMEGEPGFRKLQPADAPREQVEELLHTLNELAKTNALSRDDLDKLILNTFKLPADDVPPTAGVSPTTKLDKAFATLEAESQEVSKRLAAFQDPAKTYNYFVTTLAEDRELGPAQTQRLLGQRGRALDAWMEYAVKTGSDISSLDYFAAVLGPTYRASTGRFDALDDARPNLTLQQAARGALLRAFSAAGLLPALRTDAGEKWLADKVTRTVRAAEDSLALQNPDYTSAEVVALYPELAAGLASQFQAMPLTEFQKVLDAEALAGEMGPFAASLAAAGAGLGLTPAELDALRKREDFFDAARFQHFLETGESLSPEAFLASEAGQGFLVEQVKGLRATPPPDYGKESVRQAEFLKRAVSTGRVKARPSPDELAVLGQTFTQLEQDLAFDAVSERPRGFEALAQGTVEALPKNVGEEVQRQIAARFGPRPPGVEFFEPPATPLHMFTREGAEVTFFDAQGRPIPKDSPEHRERLVALRVEERRLVAQLAPGATSAEVEERLEALRVLRAEEWQALGLASPEVALAGLEKRLGPNVNLSAPLFTTGGATISQLREQGREHFTARFLLEHPEVSLAFAQGPEALRAALVGVEPPGPARDGIPAVFTSPEEFAQFLAGKQKRQGIGARPLFDVERTPSGQRAFVVTGTRLARESRGMLEEGQAQEQAARAAQQEAERQRREMERQRREAEAEEELKRRDLVRTPRTALTRFTPRNGE